MFGDDFFKGYISLSGKHVKDGLKERPLAFSEDGNDLVMRWIKPDGLRSPAHEVELRVKKNEAHLVDTYTMGIAAGEELNKWRRENNG